jgi:hypothetical protein
MRFRLRSPRPHHEKADPVEQEAWKKKLTQEAVKVQAAHPDADVEVWCEDEHRLGLKPIMRRVWVPEGEQPTATVNWRFKWLWLAGESPSPIRTNLLVDFTLDQYFNIQPSVGGFCSICRCWER